MGEGARWRSRSKWEPRFGALLVTAILVLTALPDSARAAFPGANGKIAFAKFVDASSNTEIFTVNAAGGDLTRLTNDPARDGSPAWSPDGQKLAFSTDRDGNYEIYTMNPDGSGLVRLTNNTTREWSPEWSPDGSQIVFVTDRHNAGNNNWEIYKMNADGTGETRLTKNGYYFGEDCCPAWSPDGTRIAWASEQYGGAYAIYVMNADGQNQTRLTFFSASTESGPADWSPDGKKIVFEQEECYQCEPPHGTIYTMNADGSNQVRLFAWRERGLGPVWSPDGQKIAFSRPGEGLFVMNPDATNQANIGAPVYVSDWQPLSPPGYARPRGGSPVNVRLVPAFRTCTNPNASHGAPLNVSSCSPPTEEASYVTTGHGDGGRMAGLVTFKVVGESPINPSNGDQADVQLTTSITDVRNPDLSDYTGELRVSPTIRITDRQNGGTYSPPIHPATASDAPFGFTLTCATTTETNIGSTCSAVTTADAVMPGVVREGKRSVWQLSQVRVYDGGTDGDADTAGDNTLFLTQGLFAP